MTDFDRKVTEYNLKLKNSHCRLTIFKRNSRLWLRGTLPVKERLKGSKGSKPYQQALALGKLAVADSNGLKYAFRQAKIVDSQLNQNKFNWQDWEINSTKALKTETDILSIWQQYKAYKQSIVSINSIKINYQSVENHLNTMVSQGVTNPDKVKPWLLDNLSIPVAKLTLMFLKASQNFAVEKGLIAENPFKHLSIKLKSTVKKESWDIQPFTASERDLIIKAFEESSYAEYSNLVKFLFYTGCRPCEAIALQFKHVSATHITFEQTLTRFDNFRVQEGLKTQKFRKFPINLQLKNILNSLDSIDVNKSDFIFTHKTGNLINWAYFQKRIWKDKVIQNLIDQKILEKYRNPYQMRHTFITLCLEKGIDSKDVADWVGNTPEIIYKHYAGANKLLQVPEL